MDFFFSILPDNRLFLLLDKKRGFEKSARGRNRFSLEFHIYIFVMTHPIRGKGLTQVAKYCHEKTVMPRNGINIPSTLLWLFPIHVLLCYSYFEFDSPLYSDY